MLQKAIEEEYVYSGGLNMRMYLFRAIACEKSLSFERSILHIE